eukprot:Sdes_comp15241_c0_seq1m4075
MSSGKNKIDLKIIILGQSGVGKTSLVNQYVNHRFDMTISTIGAAFVVKSWREYMLGIWDTAGQEKYSSLSAFYCRGAGAALLLYDVTDRSSFEDISKYYHLIHNAEPDCFMFLVASKLDLVTDGLKMRAVDHLEGLEKAQDWGCNYTEISSKLNFNISELFDNVARTCLCAPKIRSQLGIGNSVTLDSSEITSPTNSGCC